MNPGELRNQQLSWGKNSSGCWGDCARCHLRLLYIPKHHQCGHHRKVWSPSVVRAALELAYEDLPGWKGINGEKMREYLNAAEAQSKIEGQKRMAQLAVERAKHKAEAKGKGKGKDRDFVKQEKEQAQENLRLRLAAKAGPQPKEQAPPLSQRRAQAEAWAAHAAAAAAEGDDGDDSVPQVDKDWTTWSSGSRSAASAPGFVKVERDETPAPRTFKIDTATVVANQWATIANSLLRKEARREKLRENIRAAEIKAEEAELVMED